MLVFLSELKVTVSLLTILSPPAFRMERKFSSKIVTGLPWCLSGKEPPGNADDKGDVGPIPGSERFPAEGNGNPLQYSCLGNLMDRRAWTGSSPWGRKESDTI